MLTNTKLVSIYLCRDNFVDAFVRISNARTNMFNTDHFLHVYNVIVDYSENTIFPKMLQDAFDHSCMGHPAVTTVALLDRFGNRPPHGGDIFVIDNQVWVAQTFGWSFIGELFLR